MEFRHPKDGLIARSFAFAQDDKPPQGSPIGL